MDDMDRRHIRAHKHLVEARNFAAWSRQDRQSRVPDLNEEQHKQLQAFLNIRKKRQEEELLAMERCEVASTPGAR